MRFLLVFTSILGLAAAACGGDDGDGNGNVDAAAPDGGAVFDAAPTFDADNRGFDTLISRSWTIPAGQEIYRCTRFTVQEDVYINTFRSMSPLGTHHTVLSVNDNPTEPDGDYNCSAGSIAHSMLFASGVGSDDLSFPEGIAIPVRAGQQLDLNLHLFNVSDSAITGTSGTLIKAIPAAEVQVEAENVFGGEYGIFLPASGSEQTVNGGCRFTQDATVIALWPHMHQLGRHIRVVHESQAGNVTILDESFNFNEQVNYAIEPFEVKAGDNLDIDCTYLNDTGSLVTFGDSSEQEMCFVGIYRFPATGQGVFDCVELDL